MASARLSIATFVAASFMLLVTLPMSTLATSYLVGDAAVWSVPSSPLFYAEWVNKQSPFHIGDTLDFQYAAGDSVLLVNENDYNTCNVHPISSWINGPHAYELTIATTLFFISDSASNCHKGELLAFTASQQQLDQCRYSPALCSTSRGLRPRTTCCSY